MKQTMARIKAHCKDAGRVGKVLGPAQDHMIPGISYTPIKWDNEENPSFHLTEELIIFEQDDNPEIIVDVYVHGDDEALYEDGQQLGLTGNILRRFSHSVDEIKVTLKVNKATGYATIIKVDNRNVELK